MAGPSWAYTSMRTASVPPCWRITAIVTIGCRHLLCPQPTSAGDAASRSFWPLWMFLWAALNALFLSGDIFNLYVTLELLGLSAVALVASVPNGGRPCRPPCGIFSSVSRVP